MDASKKHHHYLISGMVMFVNADQNVGSIALNGVLIQDRQDLPAKSLGKAQQVLQINFHKNSGADETVKIVDVVLHNFVYLGHFTQEEFQVAPQGMTPQQAQTEISALLKENKPVLKVVDKDEPLSSAPI